MYSEFVENAKTFRFGCLVHNRVFSKRYLFFKGIYYNQYSYTICFVFVSGTLVILSTALLKEVVPKPLDESAVLGRFTYMYLNLFPNGLHTSSE